MNVASQNRAKFSVGLRRVSPVALAVGIVVSLVGGMLLAAGWLGASGPAHAEAPAVDYPDAISDLTLETEEDQEPPLLQWWNVIIEGTWSVPNDVDDDPATPDSRVGKTFGMTLPSEFSRFEGGGFELVEDFDDVDPSNDVTMAVCAVDEGPAPQLICTLTEAVDGLENVGGDFWMKALVSGSTTSETVVFEVGINPVIVDLPGEGGIIPEDSGEALAPYKYAIGESVAGQIWWTVGIPKQFARGGFVVTDRLDPTLENHHYTHDMRLFQRVVVDGNYVGEWVPVDQSFYTVEFGADDKTFEFEAHGLPEAGYSYQLGYRTEADGVVLEGDTFGNTATVNRVEVKSEFVITSSGGGTGEGERYARFTVDKVVAGSGASAAEGAIYTVQYSVKGAGEPAKTMSVTADTNAKSDRALLGSTFIVSEVNLPQIPGITWGEWTLEGEGVLPVGDGTYEVTPGSSAGVTLTLTNTAVTEDVEEPPTEEPPTEEPPTEEPPTEQPPMEQPPIDTPATEPPAAASDSATSGTRLAATGSGDPAPLAMTAVALLLGAGAALIVAHRRRAVAAASHSSAARG